MNNFKTGIEEITEERQIKQIEKHGYTAEHSVVNPQWYSLGQLEYAAHVLLIHPDRMRIYMQAPKGWDNDIFKKYLTKSRKERIRIAGAFLAAELDRLNLIEKNNEKGA